ncbi:MAG: molybdopterin-dependent oxidoreductase, partial [Terriglobales bacterium]
MPPAKHSEFVAIRAAGEAAEGLERRDFLKAAGVAAAGGALAACRNTGDILPLVVPDGRYVEGVAEHFATVCRECPAGCGMHIRVNEARATKPEGNPAHPVNRGKLCMRGQSSVQGLYSPDRWHGPQARDAQGRLAPIGWSAALARLAEELARAAAQPGQENVAWIGGLETGSLDRLIRDWLAAFGFPPPLYYEAFAYETLREASRWSFGEAVVPAYRFDRARMIVSFGAEFLATWISNVQFAVDFALTHSYGHVHDPAYFIAVGPRVDLTGANADENWRARPGSEALLALALAERVGARVGRGLRLPAGLPATAKLAPAEIEPATGVPADVLDRAADRLLRLRPSLVLGPGQANDSSAALSAHVICQALNELLGNVGVTVAPSVPHALSAAARHEQVAEVFRRAQSGGVRMLFLHHANPAFNFPGAFNVEAGLARIPFIVSFGRWRDETSKYAHLVLPDHHALESWGDYEPWAGLSGILQPAMRPVFDTRPTADVLLWLAAAAGDARERGSEARQREILAPLGVAPAPPLPADVAPAGSNWRQSPMAPAPNPAAFAPPVEIRTFDAYLRRRWQLRLAPGGSADEQAAAWRRLLMRGFHLEAPAADLFADIDPPERLAPPLGPGRPP